jgi:TonB family protein
VYGAFETLDSTAQHARIYQVDFGQSKLDQKFRPDTIEAPPKPLDFNKYHPQYPQDLRERGVQGSVRVFFVVDSAGQVVPPTLRVVESTHPDFAAAVMAYLRSAPFAPARRAGRPVCALITDQPFTFGIGH